MNRLGAPAPIGYDGMLSQDLTPPAVVLVHHPDDTTAAFALAGALRTAHGIDVWVHGWEIVPGDNTVEKIDDGLTRALGGLILLSGRALVGWDRAQSDALVARAAQRRSEGAFVMPVLVGANIELPPLLATWASAASDDIGTIARAILKHVGIDVGDAPALGKFLHPPPKVELELAFRREGSHVVAQVGKAEHRSFMAADEARKIRGKLRGAGTTRDRRAAVGDDRLAAVGRRLAEVLAGPVAVALSTALDPRADRGQAVLRLRADDLDLLALPWEAAFIDGLGPVALSPRTTILRVAPSKAKYRPAEVPGPLRILIAVASPADDLDIEREQELILDALEARVQKGLRQQRALTRIHVVFIDESLATLDAIREQLDAEPFHVLHISAHGGPGELVLEDASGGPTPTTAEELANLLLEVNHPPPLVVLSACSTAAPGDDVDRLHVAQVLLDAGVPAVIAMQGPVSDGYATELAHHLYRRLALSDAPSPARALADARRDVEYARIDHARRGVQFAVEVPEFGTPVAYAIDQLGDVALYDYTRPQESPPDPPTFKVPGMPERPLGWVVGHRSFTRTLRADLEDRAGVVLTGMGGLGKSSLALRVLAQVVRAGWSVVALVGVFALADLAREVVGQLDAQKMSERMTERGRGWFAALRNSKADDEILLGALCGLLTHEPIVLLLDNFEDNLVLRTDRVPVALSESGGRSPSIRDGTRQVVERLTVACRGRGALLITCRYAIGDLDLDQRELPPLHPGAVRRLLFRLKGLRTLPAAEQVKVMETLGPHPRGLEFADALVRVAHGEWQDVFRDIRKKIADLARRRGDEPPQDLDASTVERLASARRLAAEDVLLDALLATLDNETRRFLVAIAVFRRGVPGDALDAVAQTVGLDYGERWRRQAVRVLQDRTLLTETGPGMRIEAAGPRTWRQSWMVHRWTASELHAHPDPALQAAHSAAADWWLAPASVTWDDAVEGVEHRLLSGEFAGASAQAFTLHQHLVRYGKTCDALALSMRMLEGLSCEDIKYPKWLIRSADLAIRLYRSSDAGRQLQEAVRIIQEHLVRQPEDAELLRDLSSSYASLGELHGKLGNADLARRFFEDSLGIRKHLVEFEPDNADLLRDLSISYETLGEFHRGLGNTDLARRFFEDSLVLCKRLADAEPGHADLLRGLAVAYHKLGELHRALGNADLARGLFEDDLVITKRLANAEPGRTDLLWDLSVSYERLGVFHAFNNADLARRFFEGSLVIRERLADAEPGRADILHGLSVSWEKLGDLNLKLGHPDLARRFFESSLTIRERLVEAAPGRDDLLRDLSLSYGRMAFVESEHALNWLTRAVIIYRRRLAAEPTSTVVGRELALILLEAARHAGHDEAFSLLRESYTLLRGLYRRGALEAQYHELVSKLRQLVGDA